MKTNEKRITRYEGEIMMKTTMIPFLVTAILLVSTLLGKVGDNFMDLSFENALQIAQAEGKVVVVKFHADWCHWCQKMDRDTFSDPEVQGILRSYVPIRVDVEKKSGLRLAQRIGVANLPTIVFFDGRGNVIERYIGYRSPEQMKRILRLHGG